MKIKTQIWNLDAKFRSWILADVYEKTVEPTELFLPSKPQFPGLYSVSIMTSGHGKIIKLTAILKTCLNYFLLLNQSEYLLELTCWLPGTNWIARVKIWLWKYETASHWTGVLKELDGTYQRFLSPLRSILSLKERKTSGIQGKLRAKDPKVSKLQCTELKISCVNFFLLPTAKIPPRVNQTAHWMSCGDMFKKYGYSKSFVLLIAQGIFGTVDEVSFIVFCF